VFQFLNVARASGALSFSGGVQDSVGKRIFSVKLCGISVPLWWSFSLAIFSPQRESLKTRRAGGESLKDVAAGLELLDLPRSKRQVQLRNRGSSLKSRS